MLSLGACPAARDGGFIDSQKDQGKAELVTKIFITYGTTEGQTAKIAEVVADVIRNAGNEVEAVDIRQLRDVLSGDYDGVIVGASIHMGKHDKHVVEFVQKNRETLERVPSAFFSVSLAAHGDTEEAEGYVMGVLEASAMEMPLVEAAPGEFYRLPSGRVVEGTSAPDAKIVVGQYGPVVMPFSLRRVDGAWRVEAEPYYVLINQ